MLTLNVWDTYRETQRLVEQFSSVDRHFQQYRELQQSINLYKDVAFPASELLYQFAEVQSWIKIAAPAAEFRETMSALAAAIQPLPDIRELIPSMEFKGALDSFHDLNQAIKQAAFIAELDIPRVSTDDYSEEELESKTDELLSEVEENESIATLRQIRFVPFTLLDSALRNPQLMYKLNARDFEGFVAGLVDQLGFEDVVLTPRSGDGGRDVLALKKVHGISIVCAFECKRYSPERSVGPDIARALLGTISHGATRATKGILVTTSSFSPAARKFIVTEPNLDGQDFDGIVKWLHEYGERR